MVIIKGLLRKIITNWLPIIILSIIPSLSFANINNQAPLTALHGDPSAINKEIQPLDKYRPLELYEQTNRNAGNSILELHALISQLAQITINYRNIYEIIAYSLGGIILFEYLKSITMENYQNYSG